MTRKGRKNPRREGAREARGPYKRGRRRKDELVVAACRVINRDGLAGLTHRSAAEEAEIPSGSVTYYFPTRDSLVEAVFERLVLGLLERIESASETLDDAPDDLASAAALAIEVGQQELRDRGSAGALTELELILGVARNPDLAPFYRKFLDQLECVIERAIAKGLASDNPKRDARIVQSYLRGIQLEAVARPDKPRSPRTLRSDLLHLLRSLDR